MSAVPDRTPAAAAGPVPALRAATRTHHDRVDRQIDLRRLGERPYYASVLQVFDGFLRAWEARVLAALPPARHAWLHERSRRGFLQQDLRVLGIPPLTQSPAVPPLADAAAAWGSVYVMEGSALGGQVITRALGRWGVLPHTGAAYFHGWGERTGGLWAGTRALLDRELAEPQALARACRAACATFDALSHQLEQNLHEPVAGT